MTPTELRDQVVSSARALGFHRVGVAPADCERRHDAYRAWIGAGLHGEMAYLAEPKLLEARADSDAIATGARSIIAVAIAYDHRDSEPPDEHPRGRVARYARGVDYHTLIKERLTSLADALAEITGSAFAARAVTDTAPLLERAVAEQAGLGFVGKNTMLITPGLGSYTLLGELLTEALIAPTRETLPTSHCGECRACLEACPTDAFPAPFVLDATKCISYLTIESRGPIPPPLRRPMGAMIFGCDVCQDVCPYNAAAPDRATPEPALSSSDIEIERPRLADMLAMRSSGWKRLSTGRSIRRATRRGLIRNAAVAAGNSGAPELVKPLAALLDDDSAIVSETASWALLEIARAALSRSPGSPAPVTLREARDDDWATLCEIHDLARILELHSSKLVAAFLTLEVTAAPEGLFDGVVRVACIEGEAVGFAAINDAEITWFYVHPRAQRCGVGTALLSDALEVIGPREATLTVLAENEPALALYRAAGFEVVGEQSGSLAGNERFAARGLHLARPFPLVREL